ncbi:MAG: OST-HTH/LOTUS domain-containing protein, partial [Candidatus Contendobacter sp.]
QRLRVQGPEVGVVDLAQAVIAQVHGSGKLNSLTGFSVPILPRQIQGSQGGVNGCSQVTEEIQLICELLRQFVNDSCTIKVYDMDYADIISLLKSAEHATPKIEDMTSLTQAGQFIKTRSPEFNPNQYGQKNLKGVLIATGIFEIRELSHKNGNGKTVLYRTKPLSSSREYYVFPVTQDEKP